VVLVDLVVLLNSIDWFSSVRFVAKDVCGILQQLLLPFVTLFGVLLVLCVDFLSIKKSGSAIMGLALDPELPSKRCLDLRADFCSTV
jgi:hypothetical protein